MEFVSWDDYSIPKIPWFQSTNQSINGEIMVTIHTIYIYIYCIYIMSLFCTVRVVMMVMVYYHVCVQLRAAVLVNLKWIM